MCPTGVGFFTSGNHARFTGPVKRGIPDPIP
jgi:hypothetical protein